MRRAPLLVVLLAAIGALVTSVLLVARSTVGPAELAAVDAQRPEPKPAASPRLRDITGTVTDPGGGPIAGASVFADGMTVTTDENGRFRIEGVGERTRDVLVEAPGHRTVRLPLGSGDVLLTPVLRRVRRVPVSVVLPRGVVGENVRLLVRENKDAPFEVHARLDGLFDDVEVDVGTVYLIFPAQRVGGRPFQRASVRVKKPGSDTVFIEPEPGAAISGRVLDPDGEPVADAVVQARRYENGSYPVRDESTSDADGRYEVILDPGAETYLRTITQTPGRTAGMRYATSFVKAAADTTDVEIRLAAGLRTTGVLLTPDGEPARRMRVNAAHNWRRPGGSSQEPSTGAVTDDEGRFVLGGLRKGWYWISLPRDVADSSGWTLRGEIEAGAENVELRIAPAFSVRGRLLDANGAPIRTYNLLMTDGAPGTIGRELRSSTDLQGRFVFDHVPPGTYAARAVVPGHDGFTHVGTVEVRRGEPPPQDVLLRAPPIR